MWYLHFIYTVNHQLKKNNNINTPTTQIINNKLEAD